MFDLTADQEQRAVRLHRESLVVDSLSPGPIGCSAEMERCYAERLSRGMPFLAARTEVQRHIETLLLAGRYPAWRDAWYDSGVDAGSCTVGVFGPYGNWTYQQAVHDLALWQRRFDTLDWLEKVRAAPDVERIGAGGRKGVILNFQNARAIEDRLDYLDFFYDLGVRVVQLTYNSRNLLGDGCTERNPAGLSAFGVQAVGRMNELGMLVDLSHCSIPTTVDGIDISHRPVAVTHSVCRAVHDHARGKTDEVLEAIAASGGYFGVCTVPFFLTGSGRPSIHDFMAHFNHAVSIAGADSVGIASDWDRLPPSMQAIYGDVVRAELNFREEDAIDPTLETEGLESYDRLGNVTRAFVAEGYSDEEIRGFLGGNFLRTFAAACD